jgi:Domain of unknown function (DUF4286)
MVIYEITEVVRPELIDEYERYMTRHIAAVLATGYFTSATFDRDGNRYRIRYTAEDRSRLDQYLKNEAPRLRDDFKSHFPAGIELSREIWDRIDEFGNEH